MNVPCWACESEAGNGYVLTISPISASTSKTSVTICWPCFEVMDKTLTARRTRRHPDRAC